MEAAKTLASHGIQTNVFEELHPTPELSFAVRELNVFSGIVVASNKPVRKALAALSYTNVTVVKEQELPDANFSTVKSANTEEHDASELAMQYAKGIDADILVVTDVDADRLGVAAKNAEGEECLA